MSLSRTNLLLFLPLLTISAPAEAQVGRAVLGGGVGVLGGIVITLAAVVARARFQHEYLTSTDDLIHWQSVAMIATPAAGVLFGWSGRNALKGSILGSIAGLALGAVLGAGFGWGLWDDPAGPWAGGVIGAGLGLTLGGLVRGLRAWSMDPDAYLAFPRVVRALLGIPQR